MLSGNVATVNASTTGASTHTQQLDDPRKQLELKVSEGLTEVVVVSLRDINAIFTPFKEPRVIQDSGVDFKIVNNILYFTPSNKEPFGLFVTEKNDPDAPKYKLTAVPTDVPVGQMIRLIPKDQGYFNQLTARKEMLKHPDHPSFIIATLKSLAKTGEPDGFQSDENFQSNKFYIGNGLVIPTARYVSANYEIIALRVVNRNNVTIEISEPDFATLTDDTGLNDPKSPKQTAAVGIFENTVLAPGESTNVYVVRGS